MDHRIRQHYIGRKNQMKWDESHLVMVSFFFFSFFFFRVRTSCFCVVPCVVALGVLSMLNVRCASRNSATSSERSVFRLVITIIRTRLEWVLGLFSECFSFFCGIVPRRRVRFERKLSDFEDHYALQNIHTPQYARSKHQ